MYKLVYKTVTAIMLTVTGIQTVLAASGLAPQQNDDRVEVRYSTRKLSLTTKPTITKSEDKWWNDFEKYGQKDLVQYVHNLADTNPEAASWFLLTGGKHGFSSRKATMDEENLLLAAMGKVASILPENRQMRKWAKDNDIGQLHLNLLNNCIKVENRIQNIQHNLINQRSELNIINKKSSMIATAHSQWVKDIRDEFYGKIEAIRVESNARIENFEKSLKTSSPKPSKLDDLWNKYGLKLPVVIKDASLKYDGHIRQDWKDAGKLHKYDKYSDYIRQGILKAYIAFDGKWSLDQRKDIATREFLDILDFATTGHGLS